MGNVKRVERVIELGRLPSLIARISTASRSVCDLDAV
jgi:hypothetical protein